PARGDARSVDLAVLLAPAALRHCRSDGRLRRRWQRIDKACGLERTGLIHPAPRLRRPSKQTGQATIGAATECLCFADSQGWEIRWELRAWSGGAETVRIRPVGADRRVLVLLPFEPVPEQQDEERQD